MDEPADRAECSTSFWRWVALLVIVAAVQRGILVARTEVAARDSINFIQYALRFEHEPFAKVLREAEQPPGYPLAVLAASWPIRAWRGATDPATMVLAAQLASVFFGTLLVVPMALLGRKLFVPRTGLIAAALFQCLPSWVRLTSDGLSESTFLFWSATALWLACRAFHARNVIGFLMGGVAAGCAYFTRPEGAEIVLAVALAIGVSLYLRRTDWSIAHFRVAALLVGFAVFLGPFFAMTGRLTNKPTARFLLGDDAAKRAYFSAATSLPLAVWWNAHGDREGNKWLFALASLSQEVVQSSRYVGLLLAIIGLALWRKQNRIPDATWMFTILFLGHALLLVKMTASLGYLSERHTAILILVGAYPAALAIEELARRLSTVGLSSNAWAAICVMIGLASAAPTLSRGMHANRAGHRAAGEWLAQHAPASAGICDPFCWANYYAGRVFRETAANDPHEQFVILETSDNQHSRLPLIPEAKAKAASGELVYHWPENRPVDKSQVRIYRWLRTQPATVPTANRSSPTNPADG